MEKKPKIQIRVPSESLLDPIQLRAKQVAGEEEKRFQEIADEIIEILIKHSVLHKEIDRVVDTLIVKITKKLRDSTIDKILKL